MIEGKLPIPSKGEGGQRVIIDNDPERPDFYPVPTNQELGARAKIFAQELSNIHSQAERQQFIRQHGHEQFSNPGDSIITRVYYQSNGTYVMMAKSPQEWSRWENFGHDKQ